MALSAPTNPFGIRPQLGPSNNAEVERVLAGLRPYYPDLPQSGGSGPTTPAPTMPIPATPATTTPETNPADEALGLARAYFLQEAQRQGIDPSQYQSGFDSYLESILSNIPQSANYDAIFSPNIGADYLSGVEAQQRNQYRGLVNSQFGPNYADQQLGSSILDDTIASILGTEYGNAAQTFERGLARGQYNQRGYDAGLSALAQQRQAQESRLNTLGSDILGNYRSQLSGIRENALGGASGYRLGDTFNLDDYLSRASSVVNTARERAPGQLIETVGQTPLFDIGTLSNRAGQAQGAVNLNNLDVLEAANRRQQQNSQSRGLGSQGAF